MDPGEPSGLCILGLCQVSHEMWPLLHNMLNGLSDLESQWSEMKGETSFDHSHARNLSDVLKVCDQACYQLDHGGSLFGTV